MKGFDPGPELELEGMLQEAVGPEVFKPGLDRLRPYFSDYKNKFNKIKVVTIAGTNGKGETAMRLYRYLTAQGLATAVWSSPHVFSIRERFLGPAGYISYAKLKDYLKEALEKPFSFYEALFDVFCHWACDDLELDVLILEVGLGGRFDAVNLFDADFCAITSISLDHQEFLGSDLQGILREKFGVCRPLKPLVSGLKKENLKNYLKELCLDSNIPLILPDLLEDPLLNFSQRNDAVAKALAGQIFGVGNIEFPKLGFDSLFKGKFEKMTMDKGRFIFIGAHNLEGIKETLHCISQGHGELDLPTYFSKCWLSFSNRSDDELEKMVASFSEFQELFGEIILTEFVHPKAISGEKCQQVFLKLKRLVGHAKFEKNWTKNLPDSEGQILVTGSYYFIGQVQRLLFSLGASFDHKSS